MDWSWSTIYLLTEWLIRISMLIYVPQQRTPNAARAWLLLIFFLPVPGLLLYAWIGRIYVPQQRLQLAREAELHIQEAGEQLIHSTPGGFTPYRSPDPQLQHHIDLATALGEFPATENNRIEVLSGYDILLDRLLQDIEAAQHSIHLLYYIYGNDQTAQRFTDALCAAARRGISVRILLDAVGARHGLKHQAPQLRAAGAEVYGALPVSLWRKNVARFDLRNHRKIAVIDGQIAHMGSQNLVDPSFVPGFPNEELNVRVTGPVVSQLQAVFLADWYTETRQALDDSQTQNLFTLLKPETPASGSAAQVVPSGPGYGHENNRDVMMAFIYAVQKSICIVTPYFIPDEPFLTALIVAARRGVQVQLIFPQHSNHLITNLAQQSYFDQLLQANVEIYLYRPGLLHAKHMTFDDQVALIGSPNIDVRSFALNAEISLVIYDRQLTNQVKTIQNTYIEHSSRLNFADWQRRPRIRKIACNLARLADAVL
ncbi:cardiolipin synthase [Saezia sanguinis]|uniref:cardiolipin synthase n=1 Tax=Saezia sanguinis TaxID=1965230 RepID=UPI0030539259